LGGFPANNITGRTRTVGFAVRTITICRAPDSGFPEKAAQGEVSRRPLRSGMVPWGIIKCYQGLAAHAARD